MLGIITTPSQFLIPLQTQLDVLSHISSLPYSAPASLGSKAPRHRPLGRLSGQGRTRVYIFVSWNALQIKPCRKTLIHRRIVGDYRQLRSEDSAQPLPLGRAEPRGGGHHCPDWVWGWNVYVTNHLTWNISYGGLGPQTFPQHTTLNVKCLLSPVRASLFLCERTLVV